MGKQTKHDTQGAQLVWVALDLVQPNPWQTRPINRVRAEAIAKSISASRKARPDTLGLLQPPVARVVTAEGKLVTDLGPFAGGGDISAILRKTRWFVQLAFGHHRKIAFGILAAQDSAYNRLPLSLV